MYLAFSRSTQSNCCQRLTVNSATKHNRGPCTPARSSTIFRLCAFFHHHRNCIASNSQGHQLYGVHHRVLHLNGCKTDWLRESSVRWSSSDHVSVPGFSWRVVLSRDLQMLAQHELLVDELATRWAIVEASFGRHRARASGLRDDRKRGRRTPAHTTRRVSLTSVRSALTGFQHGRCSYCHELLSAQSGEVHVDHAYAFFRPACRNFCH